MVSKEILCSWVDELRFEEIFSELDKWGIQDVMLETLRKEFIGGEINHKYYDRLKIFIRSVKAKAEKEVLTIIVLTATQQQLQDNKTTPKDLPLSYYADNLEGWQPFETKESVKDIFAEYQRLKGFPLQYQCIHYFSCEDREVRDWLRNNRKNMVLWVDLLAMNDKNRQFVKYFDDGEIGGLLTSQCLAHPQSILQEQKDRAADIFMNRKDDFENYSKECSHIAFGLPNKEWLFRFLTNIAIQQKISLPANLNENRNNRDFDISPKVGYTYYENEPNR